MRSKKSWMQRHNTEQKAIRQRMSEDQDSPASSAVLIILTLLVDVSDFEPKEGCNFALQYGSSEGSKDRCCDHVARPAMGTIIVTEIPM